MAKKKNEDKKEKPSQKRVTASKKPMKQEEVDIEKYPVHVLLEKHKVKPLNAVGFLTYYGLDEVFRRDFENQEMSIMFSEGEFVDMYERYIEREI